MNSITRCFILTLAVILTSQTASAQYDHRQQRDTITDMLSHRLDFFDKDKGDSGGGGGGYGGGGYGMGGGGYGGGGGSYGGGGGGYGGGGGGYGMGGGCMCCDGGGKGGDKGGELALLGLGIPLLGLLLVPLGLLLLAALIPAIIAFIGRSNEGGLASVIPGMPNLDVLRTIDEATSAFDALARNDKCRQKVACQLGYIFKGSEKKSRTLSILDHVLPESIHKHFKPLKKAIESGETGKCDQIYECDAKDFEPLFGTIVKTIANKNSTLSN
ncbi:hypothetical protein CHUAL_006751 [Chamberlinius hualienensis]